MDILPALQSDKLIVLYTPNAAREEIALLTAELALRAAVTVLDGGNRFMPYRVAQILRRRTVNISAASNRVFIRRAFTCYEMNSLLADTRVMHQPCLILDLLSTFQDDHVPAYAARRLLTSCLEQIQRVKICAPVVITLSAPLVQDRSFLIEQVCEKADEVFMQAAPTPDAVQPALF